MKAKRTIASVLAVSMLATAVVSFHVSAADGTVTLAATKTEAEAGGTFSVDVSLADIPTTKVNVLDFAVTYDSKALTVTEVTIGEAAKTGAETDDTQVADLPVFETSIHDGEVAVSWSTSLGKDYWIDTDGVILTISGTVSDDAEGEYPIGFAPITREITDGSDKIVNSSVLVAYVLGTDSGTYELNQVPGAVIVGGGAVTTEATTTTTTTEEPIETTTESSAETTASTGESETTAKTESTTTSTGKIDSNVLYGDVNLDGKIDLSDVVLLNKAVAGAVTLTGEAKSNSECVADGALSADDSMALLQFLVHLVDKLPL